MYWGDLYKLSFPTFAGVVMAVIFPCFVGFIYYQTSNITSSSACHFKSLSTIFVLLIQILDDDNCVAHTFKFILKLKAIFEARCYCVFSIFPMNWLIIGKSSSSCLNLKIT